MFRVTKYGGIIFIYVWALDQPLNSKRKFNNQDSLVPFKIKDKTFYRYYHLYKNEELEREISNCNYNYTIIDKGYELGNYFIKIKK